MFNVQNEVSDPFYYIVETEIGVQKLIVFLRKIFGLFIYVQTAKFMIKKQT